MTFKQRSLINQVINSDIYHHLSHQTSLRDQNKGCKMWIFTLFDDVNFDIKIKAHSISVILFHF